LSTSIEMAIPEGILSSLPDLSGPLPASLPATSQALSSAPAATATPPVAERRASDGQSFLATGVESEIFDRRPWEGVASRIRRVQTLDFVELASAMATDRAALLQDVLPARTV
jgi:hypothetical protein